MKTRIAVSCGLNLENRKMTLTMRALVLAGVACLTGIAMTGPGLANDHFTVTNNLDVKLHADVYDGNDHQCDTPRSKHQIDQGEEKKLSCEGHGEGQCKVSFWYTKNGGDHYPCTEDTCGESATKVPNNANVIIAYEGDNNHVSCEGVD